MNNKQPRCFPSKVNSKRTHAFLLLVGAWLFLAWPGLWSQTDNLKIGEWKHHFAFNNCFTVVETPTQIIGATPVGLNVFNKSDLSISSITKLEGLSDYHLSALAYLPDYDYLIIGYENGNIDILHQNAIQNINNLKIKQMDGSKRINHFLVIDETLLCATDFGIIVINPEKLEISSTWYIGEEASNLKVYQLHEKDGNLYAATEKGLRRTSLLNSNPAFFSNWTTLSPTQDPYCAITAFAGQLIGALGLKGQTCTLQAFSETSVYAFASVPVFYHFEPEAETLMALSGNVIRFYNSSLQLSQIISTPTDGESSFSPAFRHIIKDDDYNLWVADYQKGLLKHKADNEFLTYTVQGPASNQCRQLLAAGQNLWIVAGGLTSGWNNLNIKATCSVLTANGWQHLTHQNTPELANVRDLIGITANPADPDNLFINSWGSGVFEMAQESGQFYVKANFTKSDDGLQNIDWAAPTGYVRIGATAFDKNNTLFITNSSVQYGLVAYFPEDQSFLRIGYQSLNTVEGLGTMLMPASGDKWMVIGRGNPKGVFVWNDNGTPRNQSDDRYRGAIDPSAENDARNVGQLLLWDDNGEEITRNVFSIAEDQNGYIWLGTDVGIVVQYQPQTIFTREKPVFSRIKVARNDGSGLADYLLENEIITAIAVDAGNRKWIGTQGNGVFLVSADGTTNVATYNTQNSLLPSNYISSISINHETGEVFIATGEGVVSIRGSATRGMDSFNQVYAFPNPVRPDFSGVITITGLMTKSNVKITDVSGKLVFETTSVGGQAFWDGTNHWGEKVKSGIYLVFVASDDGTESAVTKIAIVR